MEIGDLFGNPGGVPARPKPEKGVQIHGRTIDGVAYVRAEDVANLLRINGVCPNAEGFLRGFSAKKKSS